MGGSEPGFDVQVAGEYFEVTSVDVVPDWEACDGPFEGDGVLYADFGPVAANTASGIIEGLDTGGGCPDPPFVTANVVAMFPDGVIPDTSIEFSVKDLPIQGCQ